MVHRIRGHSAVVRVLSQRFSISAWCGASYISDDSLISGHHLVLKYGVQVLPGNTEEIELSAPGTGTAHV
jgi:hypothetical protein